MENHWKNASLLNIWIKVSPTYLPRKSKDQTLPIGSRESFTWIIQKTILCLVLDFQGLYFWFIECNQVDLEHYKKYASNTCTPTHTHMHPSPWTAIFPQPGGCNGNAQCTLAMHQVGPGESWESWCFCRIVGQNDRCFWATFNHCEKKIESTLFGTIPCTT